MVQVTLPRNPNFEVQPFDQIFSLLHLESLTLYCRPGVWILGCRTLQHGRRCRQICRRCQNPHRCPGLLCRPVCRRWWLYK